MHRRGRAALLGSAGRPGRAGSGLHPSRMARGRESERRPQGPGRWAGRPVTDGSARPDRSPRGERSAGWPARAGLFRAIAGKESRRERHEACQERSCF